MACPSAHKSSRAHILGCAIDRLDVNETITAIDRYIRLSVPCQHVVVNVAKLVHMQTDAELRDIISECQIVNADGMPIVWASRLLGDPLPCRVAGIDLFQCLVSHCAETGFRPFFFGARQEVVEQVVATLQRRYPRLSIAGLRNGYYTEAEERTIAEQIRDSQADMLFVGFSSPKKEQFLKKWIPLMGVPFCMGVGGSFDVVAGRTRRAPQWMQNAGLEWLFRIIQEPRRMWKRYAKTNPVFVWMVLKGTVRHALGMDNPKCRED